MISSLFDSEVQVLGKAAAGKDRLGRDVPGADVVKATIRARLEQVGSQEGTEYVEGRWTGYLPVDAPVTAGDRLREGSRVFAVDGHPDRETIPGFPLLNHLIVALTLTSGGTP